MAETTPPPIATPKRKRDESAVEMRLSASPTSHYAAKTVFSFRPPSLQPAARSHDPIEDGSSSPQSRVARKFGDLAIEESSEGPECASIGSEPESGGGATVAGAGILGRIGYQTVIPPPDITRFDFDAGAATTQEDMQLDCDDDDIAAARKRSKTAEADTFVPGPATNELARDTGNPRTLAIPPDDQTNDRLLVSLDPSIKDTIEAGQSGLRKSYPSINRLADTKSRIRKRVGTPPLSKRKGGAQSRAVNRVDEEEDIVIVDPVRAALTWREDEITVYDPEDKDDDGTGINGIGFKPTAAVAYQRAQKRRQQLADYKKREESEARARRNQRRREQLGGGAERARKHSIVRVHFSDTPPTTVMTT